MTLVLIRIPDGTDSKNRERSVKIVPSITITYLQDKEFKRLPATTRGKKRGVERFFPRAYTWK